MKRKTKLIISRIAVAFVMVVSVCLCVFIPNTKADDSKQASTSASETVNEVTVGSSVETASLAEKGGVIYVGAGSTYTMSDGSIEGKSNTFGGAVYVAAGGTFIMNNGSISNCEAYLGGAIYVEDGGECYINGGSITGCYAESGGAIFVGKNATLEINEDAVVEYCGNKEYESVVNVYVDGTLDSVITQKTKIIKHSNLPLAEGECCGYFLDENLTQAVNENDQITELVQDQTQAFKSVVKKLAASEDPLTINLYTKRVTDVGLAYQLNSTGTGYLVSASGTLSGEVIIPSVYKGYPVVGISDNGFLDQTAVTKIIIPDSVKTIGQYAFSNCSSLGEITISENITSIGLNAFNNCGGLSKVYIESLEAWVNVDLEADLNNTLANPFVLGTEISQQVYIEDFTTPVTHLEFDNIKKIKFGTLAGLVSLQSVVFPEGLEEIEGAAFALNVSLQSIEFPSSLKSVGAMAFVGCQSLGSVTFSDGLESIGMNAFMMCDNLTNIYIGSLEGWMNIAFEFDFNTGDFYSNPLMLVADNIMQNVYVEDYSAPVTHIEVPNVKKINDATFAGMTSLQTVVLPEGLEEIGFGAFGFTVSLTEINLPSTLKTVGDMAFSMSGIQKAMLPEGVTSVGLGAFAQCGNLTVASLPSTVETVGANAFAQCEGLAGLFVSKDVGQFNVETVYDSPIYGSPNVTVYTDLTSLSSIPSGWSQNCLYVDSSTMAEIVLNSSIEIMEAEVGLYPGFVFEGTKLVKYTGSGGVVEIPEITTIIGQLAFEECANVTSVIIPSSVTTIEAGAFYGAGLTEIYIPATVLEIQALAFAGCVNLQSIVVDPNNPNYDSRDNCNAIIIKETVGLLAACNETVIPDGVTVIAAGAYAGLTGIETLTIPSSVTSINWSAFTYCTGLKSIVIPDTVTTLGEEAFYGCSGLESVVIGNGITDIYISTFGGCTNLTSVTLGENLNSLGNIAFDNCTSLTMIYIPDSVIYTSNNVFNNCSNLKAIYCGAESQPEGWDSGWKANCDAAVFWGTSEEEYQAILQLPIDYPNFKFSGTVIIGYYTAPTGDLVIPEGVTGIAEQVFVNCTGITSVSVPNTLVSVGDYAFYGCTGITRVISKDINKWAMIDFGGAANPVLYSQNLYVGENSITEVNLTTATKIGKNAFMYMSCLTSVTIGDSVQTIGESAFLRCTGITSVTIGENVKTIKSFAFQYCENLPSITIPNSVTTIEEYAFSNCYALKNIKIGSGVTQIQANAFNGSCNLLERLDIVDVNKWATIDFVGGFSHPLDTSANNVSVYLNDQLLTDLVLTGLTSISSKAFYGFSSLTSVTIPNSISSIGEDAFSRCYNLTRVNISDINKWAMMTFERDYFANPLYNAKHLYINDVEVKEVNLTTATKVSPYAFYNCEGLTSVTIGNNVTSIGCQAFYGCTGLTSVTIGNGLSSVGDHAFNNCTSLTSVNVSDINKWAMINFNSTYANPLYYAKHLYVNDVEVTEANLNSATKVGKFAFVGCEGLTSVIIGYNATSISEYAFDACSNLSSVKIRNTVTSIGQYAFRDCVSLTVITIPISVTTVGGYVFSNCTNLATINCEAASQPSGWNSRWKDYCSATVVWLDLQGQLAAAYPNFKFEGLTIVGYNTAPTGDLIIPDGVTGIGASAFSDCTGLTSVIIPDSVSSIGSYAFSGCTGLVSAYVPSSVQTIGSYPFSNCSSSLVIYTDVVSSSAKPSGWNSTWNKKTSSTTFNVVYGKPLSEYVTVKELIKQNPKLKYNGTTITGYYTKPTGNLVIPNGVTSISSGSFKNCTGLTSVTIPDSVTNIGSNAFSGCSGLKKVNITNIDAWAQINFGNSTANPLYNAKHLYINDVEIKEVNLTTATIVSPYAFYNCSGLTNITIPDSVTSIGKSAFDGCTGLKKVNITNIDAWAQIEFGNSDANPLYYAKHLYIGEEEITEVKLSNNVTKISSLAFNNCTGLTSIEIPDSVTSIGSSAFDGCTGLTSITIPDSVTSIGGWTFYNCTGLTSVEIPISVTSIGHYAFYNCTGLTSVTIPGSVTSIGSYAFYNCTGLTSVTIPDSVTRIGENAFVCPINRVNLTDINAWAMVSLESDSDLNYYGNPVNGAEIYVNGEKVTEIVLTTATKIGNNVFEGCEGVTSVFIPAGVTNVGKDAFSSCKDLKVICCEAESLPSGWNSGWSGLCAATVVWGVSPEEYESVKTEKTQQFETLSSELAAAYPNFKFEGLTIVGYNVEPTGAIIIPEGVRVIGSFVFGDCEEITSITIPASVTGIDSWTFDGCSGITGIFIPSTVTNIGYNGLGGLNSSIIYCESASQPVGWHYYWLYSGNSTVEWGVLKEDYQKILNLPTDYPNFKFSGTVIVGYNTAPTGDLIIPDGVTGIGSTAFSDCTGLTSVIIPDSVTSIGESAFDGCTGLTTIYCEAESQPSGWNSNWNTGCSATVVWGYTGEAQSFLPAELSNLNNLVLTNDLILVKRKFN